MNNLKDAPAFPANATSQKSAATLMLAEWLTANPGKSFALARNGQTIIYDARILKPEDEIAAVFIEEVAAQ